LALANAVAGAALVGLGREQVERQLLVIGRHLAALAQLGFDFEQRLLGGLGRVLRDVALAGQAAAVLGGFGFTLHHFDEPFAHARTLGGGFVGAASETGG